MRRRSWRRHLRAIRDTRRRARRSGGVRQMQPPQWQGRGGIFAGYRLRIAHVVRDYGLTEPFVRAADSRAVNG